MFATNLFGTARLTNAVLPGMRARQRGKIINIGSLAAWVGEPGEGFYAASKAALARYTEALHHEVWALGVDVSLVEPGAFATNVLNASSESAGSIPDYDPVRQNARRTLHTSMRRGKDPATVARLVLKIAQTRTPHLHYRVGAEARWLPALSTLLPQRLHHALLRRTFDLPRRPRH